MKYLLSLFLSLIAVINICAQQKTIPEGLSKRYNLVKKSNNTSDLGKVENEAMPYLNFEKKTDVSGDFINLPLEKEVTGDWTNQDFLVTNSQIGLRGFRQMDLKQGEDGWLYLAAIVNHPQYNTNYRVWASSNGGHSWNNIMNLAGTIYTFSVSMCVESSNNNIGDSTRVFVFMISGPSTNGNDARVYFSSVRRDGSALYGNAGYFPVSGNKYSYISACSDGAYYQANTYLYFAVNESSNSNTFKGIRLFKSTNLGASFSSALIQSTSAPYDGDYVPSVAYFNSPAGLTDSIFIAVERMWGGNSSLKLIKTPTSNNGEFNTTHILNVFINTSVRPCITIAQQNPAKTILITYNFDNKVFTSYSTNSGVSWVFNELVSDKPAGYTWCSSDSLSSGGNNFVMAYSNMTGDSITIKKGTPGNWLMTNHKVNNTNSSILTAPVCAVYRTGNSKNAVLTYTSSNNNGLYFDNETFITGIQSISNNTPSGFSLEQNYPNPFNPVTNIRFSIPKSGMVTLKVYDVSGKEVAQLISENMNPGSYNFDFNASHLSSGVYFYRINAEGFADVKKMILVK